MKQSQKKQPSEIAWNILNYGAISLLVAMFIAFFIIAIYIVYDDSKTLGHAIIIVTGLLGVLAIIASGEFDKK